MSSPTMYERVIRARKYTFPKIGNVQCAVCSVQLAVRSEKCEVCSV